MVTMYFNAQKLWEVTFEGGWTNLDVVARDVLSAGDASRDGGGREELDGVAERRLGAHLAQHVQGVVVDLRRSSCISQV